MLPRIIVAAVEAAVVDWVATCGTSISCRSAYRFFHTPKVALRASLLLIKHGVFDSGDRITDDVGSVACAGLGTGGLRIGPVQSARQLRAAIGSVLLAPDAWPSSIDAAFAAERVLTS
jgi:hypothetical protein